MAFSEIELGRIKKLVGGLCERRTRPDLREQLRLEYRVKSHDVTVFERRPNWDGSPGHTEINVAKLKFIRRAGEWRLLWQRADMRWHGYDPVAQGRSLSRLVDEIDEDPYGCFFG